MADLPDIQRGHRRARRDFVHYADAQEYTEQTTSGMSRAIPQQPSGFHAARRLRAAFPSPRSSPTTDPQGHQEESVPNHDGGFDGGFYDGSGQVGDAGARVEDEEDNSDFDGDEEAMDDDTMDDMTEAMNGDYDEEEDMPGDQDKDTDDEQAESEFDAAAHGVKEINNLAHFGVSSHKPGNGVEELLSDDLEQYWQSDGQQPHLLTMHFLRRVEIRAIRFYVDYQVDESYTPTHIVFLAGTGHHDLLQFAEVTLANPSGWQDVPLESCGGGRDGRALGCWIVQMHVRENHQNGKDTHIRGLKIYAAAEDHKTGGGGGGGLLRGLAMMDVDAGQDGEGQGTVGAGRVGAAVPSLMRATTTKRRETWKAAATMRVAAESDTRAEAADLDELLRAMEAGIGPFPNVPSWMKDPKIR